VDGRAPPGGAAAGRVDGGAAVHERPCDRRNEGCDVRAGCGERRNRSHDAAGARERFGVLQPVGITVAAIAWCAGRQLAG